MSIDFESWEEKTLSGKVIYDHSPERNKNLVSKDSALVCATFTHTPSENSHIQLWPFLLCKSLWASSCLWEATPSILAKHNIPLNSCALIHLHFSTVGLFIFLPIFIIIKNLRWPFFCIQISMLVCVFRLHPRVASVDPTRVLRRLLKWPVGSISLGMIRSAYEFLVALTWKWCRTGFMSALFWLITRGNVCLF